MKKLLLALLLLPGIALAQSTVAGATQRTNALYGAVATYKTALANVAAGQTDVSLVPSVAGRVMRIVSVVAVTGATQTAITFNSKPAGAGAAISPSFTLGANGGMVLPLNSEGWFSTAAGEGLTVTTGAGSTTGILVGYVEIQ